MENIDEMNLNDQKKASVFSNGVKYGLYTGAATVLLMLLFYAIDLGRENYVQWIGTIVLIAGIVMGTINYRDKLNGGYISYGNAFLTGLYVTVVTAVITVIYSIIYVEYLDPGAMQYYMEMAEQKMVDKGLSDEMIDQQMAMAEKFATPTFRIVVGLLASTIIGAVISLITAAIFKKNDDSFSGTFNQ